MTDSAKILAQQRRDSTPQERIVIALEDIAEQIRSAVNYFKSPDFDGSPAIGAAALDAVESWENEGGKVRTDSDLPSGIERHISEVFVVGPYRYNRIEDAIAQLRRM